MTASRRRHGERGSAAIVFAVSGVALIAATGLAIDGGMAAGAYRHAQNAADAGALAAARREFLDLAATTPVIPTATEMTSVAQREVQHNSAQFVSATGTGETAASGAGGGSGGSVTLPGGGSTANHPVYVPTTTGGISAQAMLADVSTSATVSPPPPAPPATVNADLQLQDTVAQSSMTVAPTAGASWHGSSASSLTYLAYGNSQALGESGYVNCSSRQAQYNTATSTSSCSTITPPTLPVDTTMIGTLLTSANPDAQVSSNNVPSANPTIEVAGVQGTVGGVQVNADQAMSGDSLYWDPSTSGVTTVGSVSTTNLHVISPQVNVDASSLAMSASITYDPASGHPVITTHCAPATVTISAGASASVPVGSASASESYSIGSACQPLPTAVPLPSPLPTVQLPAIPGVTITFPYSSPGTSYSSVCSVNSSTGVWGCSQFKACLMQIQVTVVPTTTICIAEVDLGFNVTPMSMTNSTTTTLTVNGTPISTAGSSNDVFPQFLGGIDVTATVPQTTYFMRVLGWNQTSPTASATSDIESVVDESSTAFAASPFAMPASAWEMDGPRTFGTLTVGRQYYLYGPAMQGNSPSALMPATWQGQLASSSAHHVGATNFAVGSASLTATPQRYLGTSYYLEPVFDPTGGEILYYAVFLPVSGNPNLGTLVNSVPALQGPIVDATSAAGWTVLDAGAVSIKLVQ